jgi:hypothetical protein
MYEVIKTCSPSPWKDIVLPKLAQMHTLDNQTPLVLAVCHPNITKDIVKELIDAMTENGRSSQSDKPHNQTQLLLAIERAATCKKISEFDYLSPVIDKIHKDYPVALQQLPHLACRYNHDALLQWLIDTTDVRLNEKDYAGYTPLLTAVFYRSTECVEFLLSKVS